MDLIPRIGTFFLLIGGGAFVLFALSIVASQVNLFFLLIALVGLSLGFSFQRKKEPPPPSDRFFMLRRMNESGRKRREEREKNRKK